MTFVAAARFVRAIARSGPTRDKRAISIQLSAFSSYGLKIEYVQLPPARGRRCPSNRPSTVCASQMRSIVRLWTSAICISEPQLKADC